MRWFVTQPSRSLRDTACAAHLVEISVLFVEQAFVVPEERSVDHLKVVLRAQARRNLGKRLRHVKFAGIYQTQHPVQKPSVTSGFAAAGHAARRRSARGRATSGIT